MNVFGTLVGLVCLGILVAWAIADDADHRRSLNPQRRWDETRAARLTAKERQ